MKNEKEPIFSKLYQVLERKAQDVTTGEILTLLRNEKEVGQKELASFLKLSIGTVSNYENDVHSPDLLTLCRLADYYGVTTDYLLGRTSFRHDPKVLNRHITKEYTVTDILNTILKFDTNSLSQLMDYAGYLQSRKQNVS